MRRYARYAAKVDKSQALICAALRAAGADVVVIGTPVDLLIRFRGVVSLMECKSEPKISHNKKPRKSQQAQNEFCSTWNVPRCVTPTDALRAIGAVQTGESR